MKSRVIALGAICTLLLLILLGSYMGVSNPEWWRVSGSDSVGASPPVAPVSPLDVETMPLFPGAHSVLTDKPADLKGGSETRYEADTSASEIIAFYKDNLTAKGWTFKGEQTPPRGTVNLNWEMREPADATEISFVWLDPQGRSPYDLRADIFVIGTDNLKLSETQVPQQAGVHILVSRVPDLNSVPLYPGAENVLTRTSESILFRSTLTVTQRIITYIVRATAPDVKNYYQGLMVQQGWQYNGEGRDVSSDQILPGSLRFNWSYGGVDSPSGVWTASAIVMAKPNSSGQTDVEMRISGKTDLRP